MVRVESLCYRVGFTAIVRSLSDIVTQTMTTWF